MVPTLYVDADACPVKEEIYKVARRYKAPVFVVANSFIRTPPDAQLIVVEAGPDIADDWIASAPRRATSSSPMTFRLADRALKAGALALGATGKAFTPASIGSALAQRELMEHLRSFGEGSGGPKPFSAADRSRFLSALDAAMQKAMRG